MQHFPHELHCFTLLLHPITRLKHPADDGDAYHQKTKNHRQTDANADIRDFEEAPTESADEINHGVEQGHRLPERWQHAHRIEAAAEEDQRGNH